MLLHETFFLREVVQHLVEEGQLTHDGNAWVLAGPLAELSVPAGVRDVIGRRMSRLPEEANRLLAIGALSEVALDLPVAAQVAELEEPSALDAIDAAIEAGIIQPTSVFDHYKFTHALFRHVLVEEMNPSRQVRAHRAIAEAMEERLGDQISPADSAALLRHYERSAVLPGADRGVDHAIAVADDAARRFALDDECAALARGIDLLLDDDDRRHDLLVRRVRVLVSTETSTEAKVAAATAALVTVRAQDGPEEEFDLLGRLVLDAFGAGEVESAWAIARCSDRSVLAARRDEAAAVVGYALPGEQDHLDPDHPGSCATPMNGGRSEISCSPSHLRTSDRCTSRWAHEPKAKPSWRRLRRSPTTSEVSRWFHGLRSGCSVGTASSLNGPR